MRDRDPIDADLAKLREWRAKNGYTGPNSGELLAIPVGDGHDEYMLAELAENPRPGQMCKAAENAKKEQPLF